MDNRLGEMEERKPSACVMYAVLLFFYLCYLFITLIAVLTYMRSVKVSVDKKQGTRISYKVAIVMCVIAFSSLFLLGSACCVALFREIKQGQKIVPVDVEEPAPMVQ